jgi:hypothetical protein
VSGAPGFARPRAGSACAVALLLILAAGTWAATAATARGMSGKTGRWGLVSPFLRADFRSNDLRAAVTVKCAAT